MCWTFAALRQGFLQKAATPPARQSGYGAGSENEDCNLAL